MNMPIDRGRTAPNDLTIDISEDANIPATGWFVGKSAAGHIKVPTGWTASNVTFYGSDDNDSANAVQINDKNDNPITLTTPTANEWYEIPEAAFHGVAFLFPYSSTNQLADRVVVGRFKS